MENNKNHHGGLQQPSPQLLVDRYEHIMNSRNDNWVLWLNAIPLEYYFTNELTFKSNTIILLLILFHFNFLDRNGLWLLQCSISKYRDWLNAFFGWNWGKTKYTRLISKHLWHFPMDVLVKNIVFEISIKLVVPLIWAKSWKMNQIQTHSWYSNVLYAYRWDVDQYIVHI